MNIPEDLMYSADHQWIRVEEDGVIRIGVTDYAQDALGEVVFVDLPEIDLEIEKGNMLGEVESSKSVSEISAPMSGKIIEINDDLEVYPMKINEDPYGEGWICLMRTDGSNPIDVLLDADSYRLILEG
ncbi:MAG: glycine cleavage system protein H [Actinobacteria bacterium]|nr:glycine cleavage system protein H [Actinomycetota bacterium]MED5276676.1 glycine cleavage system protein GcvH [Actinomycetota bacterium]|tara:strand:- start:12838 stop:13221 length:384 start_codon:yes stop_codon:yes gene_type:complete